MKNFLVSVFLFSLVLFGCSGVPQLNPEVCEAGALVCDITNNVCETFPVPEPVCSYLNIACVNLDLLCSNDPESNEYKTAKSELQKATTNLKKWMIQYKKENSSESE